MIKLTVNASRKYDVVMEAKALAKAGEYIGKADGRKICVITDANVDKLYGQPKHDLWKSLEACGFDVYKYVFAGGEDHKNMSTVTDILEFLAEQSFTRSDMLLALGGGIAGDVTGFAASIFLRGIEFIQIPTTLLAVVDSSVGGKTGVNLSSGKNLAGAFWQPSLVLFDPAVLSTLSNELKLDGIAEAIKAGVIADGGIPAMLDSDAKDICTEDLLADIDMLTELAAKAVQIKKAIVEEDERESGKRALLNLGHTAAHAIEKCSDYAISHGHAVAMGMALVSNAAVKYGWCDEDSEGKTCHHRIIDMLNKFGFPLVCPYSAADLTRAALHDKKRRGGEITLVIPKAIGSCKLKKIPVEDLEKFFEAGLK